MRQQENIAGVVHAGLCTGCGMCVAVCPTSAVSMDETPGGLLFAGVDASICNGCGLCLSACGGSHLAEGLLPDHVDPFKGEVLAAFCSYANDPVVRARGQSGGVVTALLDFLLDAGQIDMALVNRMPEDGTLRPEPFLAHSKEDLLLSQGSKYCPVALNSAIPPDVGKDGKKIALVGLPCHLHSLRNVQQCNPHWHEGIGVCIGLFCDRTLAYGAIDYLVGKGGVLPENAAVFRYRDKTQGGWPGSIFIRTKSGRDIRVPSRERKAVKDYFTPPRCRLCFDKMNVLSDIAVGDAWGVNEGRDGFSVVLARTSSGLALLEAAQKSGFIILQAIDPESVFKGQVVEKRRQLWSAFSEARRINKELLPDYHIGTKFIEKNIGGLRDFVAGQCRWAEKFFKGKKSKHIVKAVKVRLYMLKLFG